MTTATWPSATFVASQVPPIPTSTTAASTGASANAAYAIATVISKNDNGCASAPSVVTVSSTICAYAATSANASTNASSVRGSPSRQMRSVMDCRCGLVKRPVRRSRVRSRASIMRAVDVLPLVPVRWMTG